jgi:hypothetical protein
VGQHLRLAAQAGGPSLDGCIEDLPVPSDLDGGVLLSGRNLDGDRTLQD